MVVKNRPHQYGLWNVRFYPSGAIDCHKPGIKTTKGLYASAPERLVERYYRNLEESGKPGPAVTSQIAIWGIVACGKCSASEGRKYLGLPVTIPEDITLKKARRIIQDFWKPKKQGTGDYAPAEDRTHLRITDFLRDKERKRVYKFIREQSKFKGFHDFIEDFSPGLYNHISHRRPKVTGDEQERLRALLMERYCSGKAIAKSYLAQSPSTPERKIYKRIKSLIDREVNILGENPSYNSFLSQLLGISEKDLEISREARDDASDITEGLTIFAILGSKLFGLPTFGIRGGEPFFTETQKTFFKREEKFIADFRLGNSPIEVKNRVAGLVNRDLERIRYKYNHGDRVWSTGEPLERLTLFLYGEPSFFSRLSTIIDDQEIRVVSANESHEHLKKVIESINQSRIKRHLRDIRPAMGLDKVLELHEEICFHPFLLLRNGNHERRDWSIACIKAINQEMREIYESGGLS